MRYAYGRGKVKGREEEDTEEEDTEEKDIEEEDIEEENTEEKDTEEEDTEEEISLRTGQLRYICERRKIHRRGKREREEGDRGRGRGRVKAWGPDGIYWIREACMG